MANVTRNESLKDLAFRGIIENEDVLFYWTLIWDSNEATELLKMIVDVEHYNYYSEVHLWQTIHKENNREVQSIA